MSPQSSLSLDQRFAALPRYAKREFVPDGADLTDVETVKNLYDRLLERPLVSAATLELWLKDRAELETVLDQAGSLLYIKMTCQTDNEAYAKAYEAFIQNVIPAAEPLGDALNKKYLNICGRLNWNSRDFEVYTKAIRTDVELFRPDNVPLQTDIQMLSQEYQKTVGAMMVNYDGKEQTLPQMSKYIYETDRHVREETWRLTAKRRLQDAQKLDDIFDKMLKLRNQVALNAGFKNFIDYKFKSLHRFDYSPQECCQYHASIKEFLVPLYREILQRRRQQMKLDVLRPWDTAVDPLGRPPLKPFAKSEELIEGCRKIFDRVDPELGVQFREMSSMGLLDLDSRKGKAPGGYQSALSEARKPFIFMNAVGTDDDVRTLLHEGGHAFHAFAAAHYLLPAYRHAPMEFCEVASMTMELFGEKFLDEFYSDEERQRSAMTHLEGIVHTLIWVAIVDSFQHWIYQHPQHTQEERKGAWLKTQKDFSAEIINWDGLEREKEYLWHRQLHIFEVPFYYIEYGIAQLGALQLWLKSKKDFKSTIGDYCRALALGGSQSLPKLFEAAGLTFDFSERTIQPLAKSLSTEIEFFR